MCYECPCGTVPLADTPPPGASNYRTRINTQLLRHLPVRHVFSQTKMSFRVIFSRKDYYTEIQATSLNQF